MRKKFKVSNFLPLPPNNFRENPNWILLSTINFNQQLNNCLCPFPIHWKKSTETYKVSKRLIIFLVAPIFKLTHALFLTIIAIHGPISTEYNLPPVSSAIFCMNIAALVAMALIDPLPIIFAADLIKCFGWAYQISHDFLRHFKYGQIHFGKLVGYFAILLTAEIILVALAAAGYVGYIRLDTYHLLINELNLSDGSHKLCLHVLCFMFAIHEGQVIALLLRTLIIPLAFLACTRMCLLYIMSRKSLSVFRIRLYAEMQIISATMRELEKLICGGFLAGVFLFVLFGTGSLYVGIRRNDISMGIPAFTIACVGVVLIQLLFHFGCFFNNVSTRLLATWKNDTNLCNQGKISSAHLKRILKSLQPISLPAGSFGIIDNEIKMNYMNNLLENLVNTVMTLREMFE